VKHGLRAILSVAALVLVSSCGVVSYEPSQAIPDVPTARKIGEYNIPQGGYNKMNIWCAGTTKVYALKDFRETAMQVLENHPDCVGK
jgi:hypothetical protein